MPIDTLLKSSSTKNALNGFLGGAAGGALVSAFTNKKSAKKLLKAGGLVALGGVAWSAYKKYQDHSNQAHDAAVTSHTTAYESEQPPMRACLSEGAMFRAMAAAAYADGHIDKQEQNRIWQEALEIGVEGESLNNLEALLANPPGVGEVISEAHTLEEKLEIYAASVLVIDADSAPGASYVADLKDRLKLPDPLTTAVDAKVRA